MDAPTGATTPDSTNASSQYVQAAQGATAQPTADKTAQPTAQPQTPAQATTPGQTQNPAAQPQGNTPATTTTAATPQPVEIKPVETGIKGIMTKVMDAIAGTQTPEIGADPQGNKYVKETTLSRGQQWARIAGEGILGAAAGWAAGKGAGNTGKAAQAGVQTGLKITDDQKQDLKDKNNEVQQSILDKANNQMLQMNMAKTAWEAVQAKIKATRDTVDWNDKKIKELIDAGGTNLGTMAGPDELRNILKVQPDVMDQLIKKGTIQIRPNYDEDGTVQGIHVIMMPTSYGDEIAPAGSVFQTYDSATNSFTDHTTTDPMPKRQLENYNSKAHSDQLDFLTKKQNIATKAAQEREANANADKAPSEIEKNKAEASKAYQDAQAAIRAGASADDPAVANLGELTARGGLTEDQLSRFGKGKDGQNTLSAVQKYLAQKYPNLNQDSIFITAQERRTSDLAKNAMHNLEGIGAIIAKRPDLIGPLNGILSSGKTVVGTNDPDLAQLNTLAGLYVLPSQGAHGSRSAQVYEKTKNDIINGLKNGPKGVAASIDAARSSLQNLADVGKPKNLDGTPFVPTSAPAPAVAPAAAPAAPTALPSPQTHVFSVSAWQRANPKGDVNAAKAAAQAAHYTVTN